MKKLQIGDKINISYDLNDIFIEDTATITFIEDNMIFTCGHCFPKNATTKIGDLIYSSGFDNSSEKEEIALIKIKESKLHLFKSINILNNYNHLKNINTIMINNRNKYYGFIISRITKNMESGWQKNNKYFINHQITKLEPPYYLVVTNNLVRNDGLSGSPWIVLQDNQLKLLGAHIGRTNGKDEQNNIIEICYVKPINSLLKINM